MVPETRGTRWLTAAQKMAIYIWGMVSGLPTPSGIYAGVYAKVDGVPRVETGARPEE